MKLVLLADNEELIANSLRRLDGWTVHVFHSLGESVKAVGVLSASDFGTEVHYDGLIYALDEVDPGWVYGRKIGGHSIIIASADPAETKKLSRLKFFPYSLRVGNDLPEIVQDVKRVIAPESRLVGGWGLKKTGGVW